MRATALSKAALVGLGRKTVTNLLVTAGMQFQDWSASYRLFSRDRLDPGAVFAHLVQQVHLQLPGEAPFMVAIDDTHTHKTGRHIPGTSYRRDPLGPKFRANFVWAQRFLQLAVALPQGAGAVGARTIPVDFQHAPTPRKPRKNAAPGEWETYETERKKANLSQLAVQRIRQVRRTLDTLVDGAQRHLWMQGDGGYTNATILKQLPERTTYTGRIREDAKLFHLPGPEDETGKRKRRPRIYGAPAPTPTAVRQDPTISWEHVLVWAAGKTHIMRVKTLGPLRSPIAGDKYTLRLIVIEPLGYRLRKNSKILYRKPAYLICTDPSLPLQQVVQAYVWRWEIEVNHRDEKHILGVGEAQVRGKLAVARVPAFLVASYSMALLAAHHVMHSNANVPGMPTPAWQKKGNSTRPAFQQIIQWMRAELWAHALGVDNFSGFVTQHAPGTNAKKFEPDVADAVLYAIK
jgi:hypothetical protein